MKPSDPPEGPNQEIEFKEAVAFEGRFSVDNLTYDADGNILSIFRNGLFENAAEIDPHFNIDALSYIYSNDRLSQVVDAADPIARPLGFPVDNASFTYDQNGNLTGDSGKGISQGEYSFINLPMKFQSAIGDLEYDYDPDGLKWERRAKDTKTYIAGIEYVDGTLFALNHEEGRIVFDVPEGPRYETAFKDHLGNARRIVSDINGDLKVASLDDADTPINEREIIEELDYYPFGMSFNLPCPEPQQTPRNFFRYNGKEWNEAGGLDLYEYGARLYDPAIGRFTGVDPLAEMRSWVSPFNYVQNNPINRIDPTGALDDPIHDSKTGEFLGHYGDSDFDGEIMLMDRFTYEKITGGNEVVISYELAEGNGTYLSDYIANNFDFSSKEDRSLVSNVFTSLIDKAHSEGLIDYNSSQLSGGKFKLDNAWGLAYYQKGSSGDDIFANIHPVSYSEYKDGQFGGGIQSLFYIHHAGDAINVLGVHEPLHRQYPGNANHKIIDPLVEKNRAFHLTSDAYKMHISTRKH